MYTQSLNGRWQFRQVDTAEWLTGQVPGGVHTDLLALGRIPDPFYGDQELAVQWVAESDWEYRLIFEPTAQLFAEERVMLVCDGLDTLAEVWLNGRSLGKTDNMFRRYRWDVREWLKSGPNELLVRFSSPVAYARARQAERPLRTPSQSIPGGSYLRKAPSQFGWDWGPQLPPIGIWKDVRLEGHSTARIEDVHVRQHHTAGRVTLKGTVRLERWSTKALEVALVLTAPDGSQQECRKTLEGTTAEATLTLDITNPQLWWPNGYGAQPLYGIEVVLSSEGKELERRSFRIGLRTVELRQEADRFGTSFTFVINGVPVFAKGANWIPADSFPTRITDRTLEHLIASAAQAHMNMLRVWGGGFYEEERFYDLCDRYGILVWQDFIFSCSMYPEDEGFFENVRVEAIENVRRLRHHPSLVLWCGNNEMEWGWVEWGWNIPQNLSLKRAYDRMFHHLLPEVCATEDPDRPYWPSSPSSGVPFHDPNSVLAGDTHNWLVWHGNQPFTGYREHPSRFVSEFGFQSLPSLETIRLYADEADWNMTSYVMEHHQRSDIGNGKMIWYLTDHFRLPRDFPSLVYLTQVLQAEAMRTGVEHWRRNRECTSGTLYWQLNDCWPVASWSSIDYYGRWKALHYAARRFFAPVLLSAEDWGTLVTLYVTNDQTQEWRGTVHWSLETLEGTVLEAGSEQVAVPALSAVKVRAFDFTSQVTPSNQREVVFVHELRDGDRRLSMGIVPFVPSKHLKLTDPGLTVTVHETSEGFEIQLKAERLARFVWLALEGADEATNGAIFSDNYFDLPAGRTITITLPPLDGWDIERVRRALRVRSLVDSF